MKKMFNLIKLNCIIWLLNIRKFNVTCFYLLVFIDKLGKAVKQHQSQWFICIRASKPKKINIILYNLTDKKEG